MPVVCSGSGLWAWPCTPCCKPTAFGRRETRPSLESNPYESPPRSRPRAGLAGASL
jgi:hypothetical protein